jgi:tetratricopeptide (TPR) repeat protein
MTRNRMQQARTALTANPSQAQHWIDYVQALIDAGDLAEADKTLAVATRKGLAAFELQELASRLAQARQCSPPHEPLASARLRIGSPDQQAIDELAALFEAKRFEQLLPLAQQMTLRHPKFAFGWSVLGATLAAMGRHADALGPHESMVQLVPLDANARFNLAQVHLALGDEEQSEIHLRRAVQLDPGHTEALAALGRRFHARNELTGARECFTHYSSLHAPTPPTTSAPFFKL